jgi:hypothetical protein
LTERYTALTSGQGRLSADVANVHTQLNTMTEDLAAGNSSLKEQLATASRPSQLRSPDCPRASSSFGPPQPLAAVAQEQITAG